MSVLLSPPVCSSAPPSRLCSPAILPPAVHADESAAAGEDRGDVARAAAEATKGKKTLEPIHLEVSRASAGAIEAIEALGGTVTCAHFNRLALRALVSTASGVFVVCVCACTIFQVFPGVVWYCVASWQLLLPSRLWGPMPHVVEDGFGYRFHVEKCSSLAW